MFVDVKPKLEPSTSQSTSSINNQYTGKYWVYIDWLLEDCIRYLSLHVIKRDYDDKTGMNFIIFILIFVEISL